MRNADFHQNHYFEIQKESVSENTSLSKYQLNFKSSSDDLRGLDLVLKYDPNLINIESIHMGDVFDDKFLKLESLDKVNGKYALSLWTQDDALCQVKNSLVKSIFFRFSVILAKKLLLTAVQQMQKIKKSVILSKRLRFRCLPSLN